MNQFVLNTRYFKTEENQMGKVKLFHTIEETNL